ncbi:MAG: transketolase [Proteobacteria bacterium]|nr:MAG: transketolase [Pseudomonadota bacterium]
MSAELVTRPHRGALVRYGAERAAVCVLSADLTSSCEADGFREVYPERFFSMGMAEQNMMGFAGGLAREGFSPHVHTFAVFITRRPFDQVAMSIAYPNLPVRLLGFLPGISTPGGVTHQAIEDLAVMRALPNMTVVCCADATEVESLLPALEAVDGPVYARVLRGAVPRLFPADEPLLVGQPRVLGEGDELTVISCGIGTEEALRAVPLLRAAGLSITHLHLSTLKLAREAGSSIGDEEPLIAALRGAEKGVITIENHSVIGGLGSAVAERMAELGCGVPLFRLGLADTFAHGASRGYLLSRYGLDAWALVRAAQRLAGRELGVGEADLPSTAAALGVSREAKAEDL